ncbi:MAG: M12 family metallo-peptidase [Planctomycetaceae bacterium]|nr:M12 family metallo-peptidase [Planctomycetaceae bacterium]
MPSLLPLALCFLAPNAATGAMTSPRPTQGAPASEVVSSRAAAPTIPAEVRFDAAALLALAKGDALPAAFDVAGGRGLRLRHRTHVDAPGNLADGIHLQFEHPLRQDREASLLVREGRVTGFISTGLLRNELTSPKAGVAFVAAPVAGSDLPCATAPKHRIPASDDDVGGANGGAGEGGLAGVPSCDTGSEIDVFVAYTAAATAQAGSEPEMIDDILWAIGDSNTIYAESGVAQTIRLVGTAPAEGYVEDAASMANDLYALQSPDDGPLDGVLAQAVAAGADLVALVRANGGGACGIAFLVGETVDQAAYGVSVTALGCFSNRTFTHELGHNMGCCHAPGDGGGCLSGGVFPYSTGHRFVGTNGTEYRTVMAYSPGTRIGRFSSPSVLFQGTPTGIADERDNARSMNTTRLIVANFRCSPCPGDFDGNREVNAADLAAMLGNWGVGSAIADLNGDDNTDAADLSILLGNWGTCG